MVTWRHIHLCALWHVVHDLWVMHSGALWLYVGHQRFWARVQVPGNGDYQCHHTKIHVQQSLIIMDQNLQWTIVNFFLDMRLLQESFVFKIKKSPNIKTFM
jgi:hypothetical protein